MIAIGPLVRALLTPITAITSHHLPFSVTILFSLSFYILGGMVYGLADKIWIVFLALSLRGAGTAFGSAVVHTYIGEMGTQIDEIRKEQCKRPRKFILYIAYSFFLNGGFFFSYGECIRVAI